MVSSWLEASNFLVIVAVPDEQALLGLHDEALLRDIGFTLVQEPDLEDQATALALQPGKQTRRLCAQLPLALRQEAVV